MSFKHLHLHTDGSKLDGFIQIEHAIKKVKALGQNGFAITDHGTMSMLLEAQKAEEKHGIKIVKGCEFYADHHWETEGGKYGHLILLAKNETGLKNMFELQAKARRNFKYKPRIKRDWLKEHHDGLICMSACLGGEIPQAILVNQDVDASINFYKGIFGDDYYLEVQPNSIPEQLYVNRKLADLSKKHNVKLVASNDCHYVDKEDAFYHELLLALSVGRKWDDAKRFKFTTNDFWIKSDSEMLEGLLSSGLTRAEAQSAMEETSNIFDACNAQIKSGHYLQEYPFKSEEQSDSDLLIERTTQGAKERGYTHDAKLKYELDIIDEEGYSGYFLTVADYIKRARDAGILVGPGRGSGGGSRVAYCNDIIRVNPDDYNLLFERFMAKGREPDIDSDFSDIDAVYDLLADAYGWDNVSRIIAKARFTAKNATRRVLGTFGIKSAGLSKFSKAFPDRPPAAPAITIDEALEENPALADMFHDVQAQLEQKLGVIPNILEMVRKMQGRISHYSKHAGGVLIYPGITSLLPMSSDSDNRLKMVSEFDMDELHDLGHFKYDILGLETLPLIDKCLQNIEAKHGEVPNLDDLTLDDKEVYSAISSGDLTGAFQIEAQKHMALTQRPRNFEDLSVLNAILRPGVADFDEYMERRLGTSPYNMPEAAKPFMDETYGLMVYQEQYLQLANTFAGWDLAYADANLRKNKLLSPYGPGVDEENEKLFIDGGIANGYEADFMKSMWDDIVLILRGGYGFNKSHAVLYAKICYWTVWLKIKYPECFYAALMTIKGDDQAKIGVLISEAKAKGIKVLPPNINTSTDEFTVTGDGISYRMTTIKSVGNSAIKELRKIRPVTSLSDMLERGSGTNLKKNVVINLIKAGCFDNTNTDRNALIKEYLMTRRTKTQIKNNEDVEWTPIPHFEMEDEVLGQYLTDNPLDKYLFKPMHTQTGEFRLIGGKITAIKEIVDKNNNKMAFIKVQTKYEVIEVVCFASSYEGYKHMLFEGGLYLMKGRYSKGNILLNHLEVLT